MTNINSIKNNKFIKYHNFTINMEQEFKQTVIKFRLKNKNFLKSQSALNNKSMYEYLDQILTELRENGKIEL